MKLKLPSKRAFVLTLKITGMLALMSIAYGLILAILDCLAGRVATAAFYIALIAVGAIGLIKNIDKAENDNE